MSRPPDLRAQTPSSNPDPNNRRRAAAILLQSFTQHRPRVHCLHSRSFCCWHRGVTTISSRLSLQNDHSLVAICNHLLYASPRPVQDIGSARPSLNAETSCFPAPNVPDVSASPLGSQQHDGASIPKLIPSQYFGNETGEGHVLQFAQVPASDLADLLPFLPCHACVLTKENRRVRPQSRR